MQLLWDYPASPAFSTFQELSLTQLVTFAAELKEIQPDPEWPAEIQANLARDKGLLAQALILARHGQRIFFAEDKQGWYFATE
jgi:hypothetical protein